MVNISDVKLDICCEYCVNSREYLGICGSGRRCGILCGNTLVLPYTRTVDYTKFTSGIIEKE